MTLIQEISRELAFSENDLNRIIQTAPARYKTYTIPKRRGDRLRIIAQPSRELKDIQRYLVSNTLADLPVHDAATAYVKGKSIRHNAVLHVRNRAILKLDFQDFFHSITFSDLADVLTRFPSFTIPREEWSIIERSLFWFNRQAGRLCLSIGAPSSPFVSNVVMYEFDTQISAIASKEGAAYTRYADDISVSANTVEQLRAVESQIYEVVSQLLHPRLRFNSEKTGIYTKAGRRIITGLIITPNGRVSLGRKRKRQLSAAVHHILTGANRSEDHVSQTRGWLAFASSVEPFFLRSLRRKYGAIVGEILGASI